MALNAYLVVASVLFYCCLCGLRALCQHLFVEAGFLQVLALRTAGSVRNLAYNNKGVVEIPSDVNLLLLDDCVVGHREDQIELVELGCSRYSCQDGGASVTQTEQSWTESTIDADTALNEVLLGQKKKNGLLYKKPSLATVHNMC
jgi:hypothetical protein